MRIALLALALAAACTPQNGTPVTGHTKAVPLQPPARFDHDYPGDVETRVVFADNAWKQCSGNGKIDLPRNTVACSQVIDKVCVIYIALDKPGLDVKAVTRHEEAHCNGWGPRHEG